MPTIFLLLVSILPATLHAQGVLGLGSDATIALPGTVRVTVSASVEEFGRRFTRAGDGSLEPLGADFTLDTLGVREFPRLSLTQSGIRTLAGDPTFTVSLGRLETQLTGRVERLPIGIEVGVFRRLALFATVPIVLTRTTVTIGSGIGGDATVGVNPALMNATAFNRDTALVNAFLRASAALEAKLAACEGSTSAECASVNSDRAGAQALAASAQAFASNLRSVYVESMAVPVVAGSAQTAIESRIATFKSQFASYTIGELASAPAPVAAAPLSYLDLQRLLTDTAFAIRAHPLFTTQRVSVGDVELGAKAVLIDAMPQSTGGRQRLFGLRLAVGGLVRFGSGKTDLAENFVDIGTGDGQTDIEGNAAIDLAIGRRMLTSLAARYVAQLADEPLVRIPDYPGQPFVVASRQHAVSRDLGDIFEVEITPRFALNDFFALAGWYQVKRKGEDRYSADLSDIPEGPLLDVAVLSIGTALTEHRAGFGFAFSNMTAFRRGRARFPYELSYLHFETTRASRGMTPDLSGDVVRARVYVRLWGR